MFAVNSQWLWRSATSGRATSRGPRSTPCRLLQPIPGIPWLSRTWAPYSAKRATACGLSTICAALSRSIPWTRRPCTASPSPVEPATWSRPRSISKRCWRWRHPRNCAVWPEMGSRRLRPESSRPVDHAWMRSSTCWMPCGSFAASRCRRSIFSSCLITSCLNSDCRTFVHGAKEL